MRRGLRGLALAAMMLVPMTGESMAIKGVAFQPDTQAGSAWLPNYDWLRGAVVQELQDLKAATGLTEIVVIVSAGQQVGYPVPAAAELARLQAFLTDAGAAGFRVGLIVGTPCVISNAAVAAAGNPWGRLHVGGRKAGETVNGWRLFWDVAPCGEDYSDEALAWYHRVLGGITHGDVAYVSLAGDYRTPFASEVNMFFAENPFREQIGSHLVKVADDLRATYPGLKVGLSSTLSWWKTGAAVYDQAAYIATMLSSFDFVEVASRYGINLDALLSSYPASKVILTDMKMNYGFAPSPYSAIAWHLNQAELRGLAGWWLWEYRHYSPAEGGVRERQINGGAWNEKLVRLLQADTYDQEVP